MRRQNPLFLPDNLRRGGPLVRRVREVATRHDATPGAGGTRVGGRRPNVVVIPGARTVAQLEANVAAAELELGGAELDRLAAASARFSAAVGH